MRKYLVFLSFHGRATRLAFWRFQMASTIILGVMMLLTLLLVPAIGPIGGIVLLPMAPVLVAAIATTVRRLHDRNRTGWWIVPYAVVPSLLSSPAAARGGGGVTILEALAALAGLAFSLWTVLDVGLLGGTKGLNRYGADPQAPSIRETFG